MNTKEKILLVQLLLKDIINNDNYNCEKRALKVNTLCKELTHETQNDEYMILAEFCDTYINIGKKHNDWDGRMFRQPFPMGCGKMHKLHGLQRTIGNKSNEFQSTIEEFLLNPDDVLDDWNEWINK